MLSSIFLILGSMITIGWGIAHIIPTNRVVAGFGDISRENRLIITMEWIGEGLTLCFIGLLVLIITLMGFSGDQAGLIVIWLAASMLIVMAILTIFTGARTSITPIKICPFVIILAAVLIFIGSVV
ncbi:MAG: hypothetical protein WCP36_07730 [Methanomicrobiales archaeon]